MLYKVAFLISKSVCEYLLSEIILTTEPQRLTDWFSRCPGMQLIQNSNPDQALKYKPKTLNLNIIWLRMLNTRISDQYFMMHLKITENKP